MDGMDGKEVKDIVNIADRPAARERYRDEAIRLAFGGLKMRARRLITRCEAEFRAGLTSPTGVQTTLVGPDADEVNEITEALATAHIEGVRRQQFKAIEDATHATIKAAQAVAKEKAAARERRNSARRVARRLKAARKARR